MPPEKEAPSGVGPVPQTEDDIARIPWCQALLSKPDTTIFTPESRRRADPPQSKQGHDRLFARTLAGPDAIPTCLCFHKTAVPGADSSPYVTELSTLFSLAGGIDGYPGVMHGGAVAVLMDEVLGVLMQRNMELGSDHAVFRAGTATATMDVRFRRPIRTPSVVRGRGRVVRLEERRVHLAAEIMDERGEVLASCESMWVAVGGKKPRL